MDASLQTQAAELASKMAGQAKTVEDLNSLMRSMMKSALERMLGTEMDVHLGCNSLAVGDDESVDEPAADTEASPAALGGVRRKPNRRMGEAPRPYKAKWVN